MQQLPSEIKRNIATPSGRVRGCGMTPKVLREVAREAATRAGIENLAAHDLWRTCARLCFSGGELGSDSVLAWPCFHVDRDQRRSGELSIEPTCEHQGRNNSLHSVSGNAVSVVASSRANDQRVLLRASKVLDHVLARQRFPHRPERFLIHQPRRAPAGSVLCATAAVVCPFARMRASRIAGVQRAVCATDDVNEVHAPIVADPATLRFPIQNRTSPGPDRS